MAEIHTIDELKAKFADIHPRPGILLPEAFWDARPVFEHIRQAAHARGRCPDVLLHVVLARVAGAIPHTLKLPAIVGTRQPLNYFTALPAPSGSGKSSAQGIGADLVPVDRTRILDRLPAGSGEGLVEVLFKFKKEEDLVTGKTVQEKRQTYFNAIVYIDEGDALLALGKRNGSTTMSTIRSIWTGATIGNTNASQERRRIVDAGQYAYGLVLGLSLNSAAALLDEAEAGTPQRFAWAWGIDPSIPEQASEWPGPLDWEVPNVGDLRLLEVRTGNGGYTTHEMRVTPSVRKEIRAKGLEVMRGEVQLDPLDSHIGLLKLKIAGLLSILDNRFDVTEDDWEIADTITTTSCAVRDHVADAAAYEAEERERSISSRLAKRSVHADDVREQHQIEKAAKRIAQIVAVVKTSISVGDVNRRLSIAQREVKELAIDYAKSENWVSEYTEPGQHGPMRMLQRTSQ